MNKSRKLRGSGLNRGVVLGVAAAIIMAGITAAPALAQVKPVKSGSPESVGFSSERLAKIDAAMQAQIESGRYTGVALMIARHGVLIKNARYGYQDLASRQPLRSDAIFRQASQTKPIIGAALWMLYEDGKWQLDDPLSKFIPEFANLRVATSDGGTEPLNHPITMRELMSSSAGWPGIVDAATPIMAAYAKANIRTGTLAEMIAKLAKLPLAYQPGTTYRYGVQHDIMGAVIERLSGQTLDVFLQERMFKPLDMVDTGFGVPESQRYRLTPTYAYDAQDRLVLAKEQTWPFEGRKAGERGPFLSGAGGLHSTMADFIRFLVMLSNGGEFNGRRLLAPSTIELMGRNLFADGTKMEFLQPFEHVGQNGGFAIVLDRANATLNSGAWGEGTMFWGGSFGTWCWVDPSNDIVVLGMSQLETAAAAWMGYPSKAPDLRALSKSLTYQALVDPSK